MEELMHLPILTLASSAIAAALLWPTMADADDRPVMLNGRVIPELHGIWRSRGYGYVVRLESEGAELFHVAREFCYPDPRNERDPEGMFKYFRRVEPSTVAFSSEPGDSRYVFDRVPSLPTACSDQTPWTPSRIAGLVAAIFTDLYPPRSFEQFGVDWRARVAALERERPSIADDAALFGALEALLDGIEDAHVELHGTVGGRSRELVPGDGATLKEVEARLGGSSPVRQWRQAYRQGILETVLQGKGHETANRRVLWGRVGDIGYINLLAMGGFSANNTGGRAAADAVFDQAFAAFDGARAVIVDVSANTGGSDAFALHVASRFADRPRLAFTKIGVGAQGIDPQPLYVEPSPRSRYLGPVYVLMSDVTVSAGEIFALAMRAMPNVVLVGGPTRGAFSDAIDKPLPNGWKLNLSAEDYRDPEERSYETKGLPPHIARDVFPRHDLSRGHARLVLSLMKEIVEQGRPSERGN
jgi:carboxyl-terminal processing protease